MDGHSGAAKEEANVQEIKWRLETFSITLHHPVVTLRWTTLKTGPQLLRDDKRGAVQSSKRGRHLSGTAQKKEGRFQKASAEGAPPRAFEAPQWPTAAAGPAASPLGSRGRGALRPRSARAPPEVPGLKQTSCSKAEGPAADAVPRAGKDSLFLWAAQGRQSQRGRVPALVRVSPAGASLSATQGFGKSPAAPLLLCPAREAVGTEKLCREASGHLRHLRPGRRSLFTARARHRDGGAPAVPGAWANTAASPWTDG
ncbi:uncharacterized protein [Struthio camelus]|uniref:uncharacterized protein n=1 Tax=Struthio camelus TaxID=8801 RepID=UPI00360413D4